MQLQICSSYPSETAHDDAHGREAFQVQSMQQSLQTKERSHKTFPSSHNLRVDHDFCFEMKKIGFFNITKKCPFAWLCSHGQLCCIAIWGSCNGKLKIGFFSFLREKYTWKIWTPIKWEAKLKNLSEIF